jgi:cysteine desulfurase
VIYLDSNASTRPSPAVVEAMARACTEFWENPSSTHRPGQFARQQVELARKHTADLLNAKPRDVVFCSSGTEAADLAVRGVMKANAACAGAPGGAGGRRCLITTKIEHHAVRDIGEEWEQSGEYGVRWLRVHEHGVICLEHLAEILDDSVALVSVQWANNETGAVQPVEEISRLCRQRGALFHCDGVQWVGKEQTDVCAPGSAPGIAPGSGTAGGTGPAAAAPSANGAAHRAAPAPGVFDLLTASPHKYHGPKGIGVLWARRGVRLRPLVLGSQEMGRRGGTENVPGIVGAGVAACEAKAWLADPANRARGAALRDRFERAVLEAIPEARVNGPTAPGSRMWNTSNIGFPRLEAEAILLLLSERGVCASAGAACSSGSLDPSPVLMAMHVPAEYAHGSVRFSIDKHTTEHDLDEAARTVIECVRSLYRSMAVA